MICNEGVSAGGAHSETKVEPYPTRVTSSALFRFSRLDRLTYTCLNKRYTLGIRCKTGSAVFTVSCTPGCNAKHR